MKHNEWKAVVEGLLFASGDEGVTIKQLSKAIGITDRSVTPLLEELQFDYEHADRGLMLIQSHETYHLTTKPEHSTYLKKFLATPQTTKLSQAALESLAIIAYNQPITRTEIEEIRGVKSDRPVQTLLKKTLIEEAGRKEGAGRPILFATTKDFLTYFGLMSLHELPPLPENPDGEDVEQEANLFFGNLAEDSLENTEAEENTET